MDRPQIHVVYATLFDGVDRARDTSGEIDAYITALNSFLEAQTGRRLRFDIYAGPVDVTFLRLPFIRRNIQVQQERGGNFRSALEAAVLSYMGQPRPDKVYVVYLEDINPLCGEASAGDRVMFIYLAGAAPLGNANCATNPFASSALAHPSYPTVGALHELLRMVGIPVTQGDPRDLMHFTQTPYYITGGQRIDIARNVYWNQLQALPYLVNSFGY